MKKLLLSCFSFLLTTSYLFAQPGNNACSGTVPLLTSGVTVTGTVANATLDGPAALNSCDPNTERYDVWYRFTAQSVNPTIYLTNLGSNFTSPRLQVATSCTAGSLGCGTTSLSLTGLTIGTTYYIRVFSTAGSTPSTNAGFDITVVDPPVNDLAASAIVLTPTVACELNVSLKVNQSIALATFTSGANSGSCTNADARDVWYKFVATDTTHTVLLSNLGSSWGTSQKIQLLTNAQADGSGTWTNIACSSASVLTSNTTVGTTYFIRIHRNSTNATSDPFWKFDICLNKSVVTGSRMKEVFSRKILSAASAMNNPWEIIYGPDNNLWVTDSKNYRVYKIDPATGDKTTILDLGNTGSHPYRCQYNNVSVAFQGGLAGMALHPNFLDNTADEKNWVYLSYGYSQQSGNFFTTRLVRFTYNKATQLLEQYTLICDSLPGSNDHNSQRMIIAPETIGGEKFLFYACGDMGAGQGSNPNRPIRSQLPDSYEGKILRFNLKEDDDDAQTPMNYNRWIPNDNPYKDILGKQSAVWNIGIRNNQGFAYDSVSGILYGTSHGAYSDDEINILQRFKNYGHPLILGYVDGNYDGNLTQGTSTSYSAGSPFTSSSGISTCPPIGTETARRTEINGMGYGDYKDPLFSAYAGPATGTTSVKNIWTNNPSNSIWPSEGWSGLDLYTNKAIPGWKQSLVASGLKWGRLLRLKLSPDGTKTMPSNLSEGNVGDTVLYFQSANRYRDIAFGPNGRDIYVIMDNNAASVATDGNPPVTPACAGCLIKYSFLGYADDGSGKSTIPKSIDVTAGTPDICNAGTGVTIDATNNSLWVPITGPDGNIMAEINAMGQSLGAITSSFFQNTAPVRVKAGMKYLDRSITITPAVTTFGTPVKVRLYISKAEYNRLVSSGSSGLTGIGSLKVMKNNDACSGTATAPFTAFTPTNTATVDLDHGTNGYVLQIEVASFSTFYFSSGAVTLPLDLISFTGTLQNNSSTLLKWKTENERNTANFEVERSTDAANFGKIGDVAATGNSSTVENYTFTDNDVADQSSQIVYYRLRMVDQDGKFKYSNVISVTLADIVGKINAMPNPVTNETKLTVTAAQDGPLSYKIIDNAGRIVVQKSVNVKKGGNTIVINMSRFASGSYFLNVSGAGVSSSLKLQKL